MLVEVLFTTGHDNSLPDGHPLAWAGLGQFITPQKMASWIDNPSSQGAIPSEVNTLQLGAREIHTEFIKKVSDYTEDVSDAVIVDRVLSRKQGGRIKRSELSFRALQDELKKARKTRIEYRDIKDRLKREGHHTNWGVTKDLRFHAACRIDLEPEIISDLLIRVGRPGQQAVSKYRIPYWSLLSQDQVDAIRNRTTMVPVIDVGWSTSDLLIVP